MCSRALLWFFFFFNDTATTEIYTLSLHDALPISVSGPQTDCRLELRDCPVAITSLRSEEHTSELQSLAYLVCRLLLEKKKTLARGLSPSQPQCPFHSASRLRVTCDHYSDGCLRHD